MPKREEIYEQLYVVECRNPDGTLNFAEPQPESYFGMAAITGITDNAMSHAIFRTLPDAVMTGDSIPSWPQLIDVRWSARKKTW